MAFAGLVLLFGGVEMSEGLAKLPGILLALGGAIGFAFGTIFLKKWPIQLPGATSAAWQIGLGCLPVALAGIIFERPDVAALNAGGWAAIVYMTLGQFCIAYVAWFAALERLPASVAAIATMLVPVIGVTVSAVGTGRAAGAGKDRSARAHRLRRGIGGKVMRASADGAQGTGGRRAASPPQASPF